MPDALKVAPAGRAVSNGTFEGLTLLPGGRTLLASMEIEGMVVTGGGKGSAKVLLVSDDNQNAVQTTRLYHLLVRI